MAILFETREAAFNAVPLFIELLVVGPLLFAVGLGWDDRLGFLGLNVLDNGVCIIAFVGQRRFGFALPSSAMAWVQSLTSPPVNRNRSGSPSWLQSR